MLYRISCQQSRNQIKRKDKNIIGFISSVKLLGVKLLEIENDKRRNKPFKKYEIYH